MAMTLEQIINYSITLVALFGAILAWIAKIKWSEEYKTAKEAQLDAVKEKADLYESIISKKLIDYSKKTIEELELHLNEIEQSKQEEINKILEKLREYEANFNKEKLNREEIPLLANLSHELRTPVNAIVGFSHLLNTEDISKEERVEYQRIIEENAIHILSVLEDVVQYYRSLHQ